MPVKVVFVDSVTGDVSGTWYTDENQTKRPNTAQGQIFVDVTEDGVESRVTRDYSDKRWNGQRFVNKNVP